MWWREPEVHGARAVRHLETAALARSQHSLQALRTQMRLDQGFIAWELPAGGSKRDTLSYTRWAREEPGRPSLDRANSIENARAKRSRRRAEGARGVSVGR